MSTPYPPFQPGYPTYPGPVQPGDKRPVTAVISLVLGAVVFGGTLIAKIGAAASTDTPEGVMSTLGVASFFTLLLVVPAIVLAHLAVSSSSKGRRVGRGMAVGALVLAYVDLALFLARILAATIATITFDDPGSFFYNMFLWV